MLRFSLIVVLLIASSVSIRLPLLDPLTKNFVCPTSASVSVTHCYSLLPHANIFSGLSVGDNVEYSVLVRKQADYGYEFGARVGDFAVGVVGSVVKRNDSEVVVDVKPKVEAVTHTCPARYRVTAIEAMLPYTIASMDPVYDSDYSVDYDTTGIESSALDLFDDDKDYDVMGGFGGGDSIAALLNTRETSGNKEGRRRYNLACALIGELGLKAEEVADLMAWDSGVERLEAVKKIVNVRLGQASLQWGSGVDLVVKADTGVPAAAKR